MEGITGICVLAADSVKLNIPSLAIRMKSGHDGLLHPGRIAGNLGMDYIVTPYSGENLITILKNSRFDLGIVSGPGYLARK
jgi:hypothetical protein